jgi:hypothetical protein
MIEQLNDLTWWKKNSGDIGLYQMHLSPLSATILQLICEDMIRVAEKIICGSVLIIKHVEKMLIMKGITGFMKL